MNKFIKNAFEVSTLAKMWGIWSPQYSKRTYASWHCYWKYCMKRMTAVLFVRCMHLTFEIVNSVKSLARALSLSPVVLVDVLSVSIAVNSYIVVPAKSSYLTELSYQQPAPSVYSRHLWAEFPPRKNLQPPPQSQWLEAWTQDILVFLQPGCNVTSCLIARYKYSY